MKQNKDVLRYVKISNLKQTSVDGILACAKKWLWNFGLRGLSEKVGHGEKWPWSYPSPYLSGAGVG